MKIIYTIAQIFLGLHFVYGQAPIVYDPIPYFHAHNDYEKIGRKPLFEALEVGATSIEIDVFPMKNGKLKVSHIPLFLTVKRDFEKIYLQALTNYLKSNQNKIYTKDSVRLILMIDVKRNSNSAYESIRKLAIKYQDVLTVWYPDQDSIKYGPVELLISGHKPWKNLERDSIWYMRIDGGLGQIGDKKYPAKMVPRVSARYGSQFKWRGNGEIAKAEKEKLYTLVKKAHADGRQIRFWAMPNNHSVWQAMRDAGVDWLNIDKIRKLNRWHREKL